MIEKLSEEERRELVGEFAASPDTCDKALRVIDAQAKEIERLRAERGVFEAEAGRQYSYRLRLQRELC